MPTANARDQRRTREIERTRKDILEAAARVFVKGGFHSATMQQIAREAGFTAASLYTYFESKDAIYDGLRQDMQARVLASYEVAVPAGLSFAQRLELLLQRQLGEVEERIEALRVLLEQPPRPDRVREREMHSAVVDRLARFLAEEGKGELRLPPREAALILIGMLHGRVISWLAGIEQPDATRLAGRVVDVFLHGVARPTAG